ncbi:hypothetical protein Hanom_Chr16g01464991 [Helianthus anomalus]
MASIFFSKLGGFPTRQCLCHKPDLHRLTIQKLHVHAEGYRIGDKPGFRFHRIIRKPHALSTEVSYKEPKVNYSSMAYFEIFFIRV